MCTKDLKSDVDCLKKWWGILLVKRQIPVTGQHYSLLSQFTFNDLKTQIQANIRRAGHIV